MSLRFPLNFLPMSTVHTPYQAFCGLSMITRWMENEIWFVFKTPGPYTSPVANWEWHLVYFKLQAPPLGFWSLVQDFQSPPDEVMLPGIENPVALVHVSGLWNSLPITRPHWPNHCASKSMSIITVMVIKTCENLKRWVSGGRWLVTPSF